MNLTRDEFVSLGDGMIVRYRCKTGTGSFEICASRNGIVMRGEAPSITDAKGLLTLVEYLRKAYIQYRHLMPNQLDECDRIQPLAELELGNYLWWTRNNVVRRDGGMEG